jgi:DNA-binding NtrC family response regulator
MMGDFPWNHAEIQCHNGASIVKKAQKLKILIVEDDKHFQLSLKNILAEKYEIVLSSTSEQALNLLEKDSFGLVLLDIRLPQMNGMEFLKKIKAFDPELPVIMLTAVSKVSTVVEAVKLGAYDYLTKPMSAKELHITVERALDDADTKRKLDQRERLQIEQNKGYRLIGSSSALDKIREKIKTAGKSDATVLVHGETGTGKEVVSRLIHANSNRASQPFVAVNCGAIPKELIESEFFGYRKGAFTGAKRNEIGKFQLANHGTLLLDEIGDLSLEAQTKLLRVLEEEEFYPVGSTKLFRIDVRVIVSTNRDLRQMVEKNLFRKDLYFRLNIYSIFIPPLRDRPEDILPIANYFINQFNQKYDKSFSRIEDEAVHALKNHSWNGNIRELRNIIEHVILSHQGKVIKKKHLNFIQPISPQLISEDTFRLPDDGIDMEDLEKNLMKQALSQTNGNKAQAARLLSLSVPTFHYRLKKYDME